MDWRRTLLSIAFIGGCLLCLGMVQKAHSEGHATTLVSSPSTPSETSASSLASTQTHRQ